MSIQRPRTASLSILVAESAGHLYKMALEEVAGAKEVEGVEVTLLQVCA